MVMRITFVLSSNMKTWAGGKKAIYEYVRNIDRNEFEVRILEPYHYGRQTISDQELREKLKGINVNNFSYPLDKLANTIKSNFFMSIISNPLLPFRKIIFIYTRLLNRKLLKNIELKTDFFYLVNNDLAEIFSKKSKIIGSEHTYLPGIFNGTPKNSISGKIAVCLTKSSMLYRNIDAFHCINESSYVYLSQFKKSFYVPNGVDTVKYEPLDIKNKKIKLLFVGRIEKYKGIIELLTAFNKIEDKSFELHVVGKGSLDPVFQSNSNPQIYYHGFLTEDDLSELYRSSDIFVFPSRVENFGLVILEALSSGLYCIVLDQMKPRFDFFSSNGYLEYIKLSVNNIYNSILNIKKSIDLIREFERKKKVHEYIAKKYDWKIVLSELCDQILKV